MLDKIDSFIQELILNAIILMSFLYSIGQIKAYEEVEEIDLIDINNSFFRTEDLISVIIL